MFLIVIISQPSDMRLNVKLFGSSVLFPAVM